MIGKTKKTLVILLAIFTIMASFTVSSAVLRIFNLTATFDGKTLSDGDTIDLSKTNARTISIVTDPLYVDNSLLIGYTWDSSTVTVLSSGTKTAT